MGGRAGKEQKFYGRPSFQEPGQTEEGRRKVGPADTETRQRILAERLKESEPAKTKPAPAATRTSPGRLTAGGALGSGIEKLTKPKANIERALESMGE